ncbi:ankyrin repeat protein [Acanthamoeba polyphaga moumouvirus]|uniref:Ankyrin repeat protein n=1 Tax=Acanthamoeba polyphaga moumouvirus TaxID=1269028 RepID=L7RGK4_9VIRU|nr:ankyrin repeat protein [Acanthamoeba polyphaga moumouvirus]AGC02230.1 ankyrin repeat protein [Acanthamoeba polyphaga moumouvirus]
MSLTKLCEIVDSKNYEEFVKFFNEKDFISEDHITLCADFIFNPYKEEYFKILCHEVFNKTPKHMLYILNYCVRYNNLKAIKLMLEYNFDIDTENFDYPNYVIDPILYISKFCTHFECNDNICEYKDVINFLLDNDFNLNINEDFICAIEYRNYCVCRELLKYGYNIDYSNKNMMEMIYSYINDERSLQFLLNECDLQINFSDLQVKKSILSIIKYNRYKVLQLLINHGLNLHDIVQEINKVKDDEYFTNTINILLDHELDTRTICKLIHR